MIYGKERRMAKKLIILGFGLVLSLGIVSCSSKQETHISYNIPELNAEELQQMADTSAAEFTMYCTYSKYCDFCKEEFPKVFRYCKSLPIHFNVLFQVRATDSTYIYMCMKEIQKLDSSFNNFVVLSDSLYDEQYRHIEQKGLCKHYGGTVEGNKYVNYVEKYIPDQFNHECATPKLILYKKNEGIVFVNRFEMENGDLTSLSSFDKAELERIVYSKK